MPIIGRSGAQYIEGSGAHYRVVRCPQKGVQVPIIGGKVPIIGVKVPIIGGKVPILGRAGAHHRRDRCPL